MEDGKRSIRSHFAYILFAMGEMRLFNIKGQRLYLNAEERDRFLTAAADLPPEKRAFAEFLHFTGCRISEALEVVPERIEVSQARITIRSLKKRRDDIYRTIPVPPAFADSLERTFSIKARQARPRQRQTRLWPWHRHYGWEIITGIMKAAGIPPGPHRCPKGLRHGYGIAAITAGVPLNILQQLMGHADLSTTAIYANAMGQEQAEILARMWN